MDVIDLVGLHEPVGINGCTALLLKRLHLIAERVQLVVDIVQLLVALVPLHLGQLGRQCLHPVTQIFLGFLQFRRIHVAPLLFQFFDPGIQVPQLFVKPLLLVLFLDLVHQVDLGLEILFTTIDQFADDLDLVLDRKILQLLHHHLVFDGVQPVPDILHRILQLVEIFGGRIGHTVLFIPSRI